MGNTSKLSRISMVLIVVMAFTAVFNVILGGSFPAVKGVEQEVVAATGGLQKSNVNMDAVREQYLKYQTVEAKTASFDGLRWAIVELDGTTLYDAFKKSARYTDFAEYAASVEGKKVAASIKAEQSRFISKLNKRGISYTYKYSYTALNNAIAVKVDAGAYNAIASMDGVVKVSCSEHYAAPKFEKIENNANVYTTGIYKTDDLVEDTDGDGKPDSGYQGQGMAVAILDTGLDSTHEAFDPAAYQQLLDQFDAGVRYDEDTMREIVATNDLNAKSYGAGFDDFYYNVKVPFAYDYADDDTEVFPSYNSHGTHVAGIVAGRSNYVVNDGGTPDDNTDDETFVGVAPLAQLVICKVFTDNLYDDTLGGADDVDILAALEDCAMLGVDVINMSLGSSSGFSNEADDATTSKVYNRLRELGISLVCAASNDYSSGYGGGNGTNLASNPDSGTVGSPSTYTSALSVASINGQKSKYIQGNDDDDQIAFITNASDGDGNRIEFIDALHTYLENKYGQAAADAGADLRGGDVYTKGATGDLKLKYVLIGGVGRNQNYNTAVRSELRSRTMNGEKVDGTIALVKRGDTTFAEKVQLAMDSGADACIIYNNVSGTINMSLGEVEDPIPTCLITMDASIPFVQTAQDNDNIGFITVSYDFMAGPFMSDFSSWGPVSDLTLKPEITAHGGEITSSVAGAYDVYSGTSMASPNMAGAVAILRQYLQETEHLEGRELNARVNQMLMSTATIANNEEGNPYSPRKQGAGLADIASAIKSEGYITVLPNEKIYGAANSPDLGVSDSITKDGWLDKTKLELLDDPQKEGKYELVFTVHNITALPQSYAATAFVMTETIASDGKTVAEKSYSLAEMSDIEFYVGNTLLSSQGSKTTDSITVPANDMVTVKVVITLGDGARDYLDSNFKNGMYVEGFVSLKNDNGGVTLGLPYLAFYGDWGAAPLFDYDAYEIAASEADTSIDLEDKLVASAAATQVIGSYHNDDYILPLGTYLYETEEEDDDIYPERDKIALSMYDEEGNYTVYEMYSVYAGLLRNAAKVEVTFSDPVTGEIMFSNMLRYVSKSFSAGGQNRGAYVRMEINPHDWGLKNNDTFNVKVEGWLDYKDADGNYVQSTAKDDEPQTAWTEERNTFEFPLTIDYEAPQILDYNIRFESYEEYGETKYRVYLDLDVYDNQYAMAVLPCYLNEHTTGKLGNFLTLLTRYPVPVYGDKGTTNQVSVEITDYYEQYGLTGNFYVQVEDYAMNSEVYTIMLDYDSLNYPQEGVTLINDAQLQQKELDGEPMYGVNEFVTSANSDLYPAEYPIYELTLSPYELYQLNTTSDVTVFKNLNWIGDSDFVIAKENQIFGIARDPQGGVTSLQLVGEIYDNAFSTMRNVVYAQVDVTVTRGEGVLPSPSTINFMPIRNGDDAVVSLDGVASVEVNPNTQIQLDAYISPWYFEAAYKHETGKDFKLVWTTSDASNTLATVDQNGLVQTKKKGSVNVTASAEDTANYMFLSKSVELVIGDDFYVNSYTLYAYYGGPKVEIPNDLNVLYLHEDCFKNNPVIEEVILPSTLMEIPEGAFEGCPNLRKVTINSQCSTIGIGAFRNCNSLTTIEFAEYVDGNKHPLNGTIDDPEKKYYGSVTVGHFAFAGTPVKEFINGQKMTTIYDYAFAGCTELEEIDLTELRSVGSHVFAGCEKLSVVKTSPSTAIGPYMFAPYTVVEGQTQRTLTCSALTEFVYKGTRLPEYAFYRCENLASFTFESDELISIGERALANTAIGTLSLPGGTYTVGQGAFESCENLTRVTMQDSTNLVLASGSPFVGCASLTGYDIEGEGSYLMDNDGALYNADKTTLVSLPNSVESYELPASVTTIADGALSGSVLTSIDLSHVTKIGKYAFAWSNLTSVALPAGIEEIPEGAFYGCASLTSVTNTDNVKTVGANAFAYCTSLARIELPVATELGDSAFRFMRGVNRDGTANIETNMFATIIAPQLEKVGSYAFAGARIAAVNQPAMHEIGSYAYAYMPLLVSASFGAVTEMGTHAFFQSSALRSAAFAYGTTVIGDYAFSTFDYSLTFVLTAAQYYIWQSYVYITQSSTLTTVELPTSVTTIGEFAFAGQAGLKEIELGGVTTIGNSAFRECARLASANPTSATTIGDYAFNATALTAVELTNAVEIGDYAFAGKVAETDHDLDSLNGIMRELGVGDIDFGVGRTRQISGGKLATVTFPKAEVIGDFAFAGNALTSVTIPACMTSIKYNKDRYQYTEEILDDENRVKFSRERIKSALGAGVFAYNPKLVEINVEQGNPVYASIGGVLYERVENGLTLVQYPDGFAGDHGKYTVESGTVNIADSAFEGVENVNEVELPYTVKTIGSAAFYESSVQSYVFNSVKAPTLVAAYDTYALEFYKNMFAFMYLITVGDIPWSADPDSELGIRLDLGNVTMTTYYSNFNDYAFKAGFGQIYITMRDFPVLNATVPQNGVGYDSALWTEYFANITLTEELMLDDEAHVAQDAIKALDVTVEQIEALGEAKDTEKLALDGEIALKVKAARAAYNLVVDPDQRALIKTEYQQLLAIEAALREARRAAGIEVTLVSVAVESYPNNVRYRVGDTFDPTGMQLKVVYSDGSELLIEGSDISFNKTVFEEGDTSITVLYHDEFTGIDWSYALTLNIQGGSTPSGPSGPSGNEGGNDSTGGLDIWVYGLIAFGVLLAAAVVTIALVVAKQKGKGNTPDGDGDEQKGEEEQKESETPAESEQNAGEESAEGEKAEGETPAEEGLEEQTPQEGESAPQQEAQPATEEEKAPQYVSPEDYDYIDEGELVNFKREGRQSVFDVDDEE